MDEILKRKYVGCVRLTGTKEKKKVNSAVLTVQNKVQLRSGYNYR